MDTTTKSLLDLYPDLAEYLDYYPSNWIGKDEYHDFRLKSNTSLCLTWSVSEKIFATITTDQEPGISFEQFYNLCPREVREALIYHMDLFRKISALKRYK